jgi:DNA polymerase-3 subunit alpha
MPQNFCHLHVHNEFSYLDGFGSASAYAKRAKEMEFTHLALTNHGNIDGSIRFQEACDKVGIVPIHGCELYIVPNEYRKEKGERRGHITALVKNEEGWQNLSKMLTIANTEGLYYKPRIGYQNFLKHCKGLVVLTGCSSSFLMADPTDQAFDFLESLYGIIGSDLYFEVMPHELPEQNQINEQCLDCSVQVPECKLVASNDCHYILPEDAKAQEVLLAIQTKHKWKDADRFRFTINGLYLKDENEMFDQFVAQGVLTDEQINQALDATMEIADKCQFRIQKKEISLPSILGKDEDPGKFIWDLAEKKLLEISQYWDTERINRYFERLSYEWKVVNDKHFSPYFVIVWELVSWCRKNGIMTGPARGSAGGSLLAYLLGITQAMDPLEYGLIFERFIAEDRNDYPDIDIDFQDSERYRVRQHLEALYGKDHISSLSTFSTMKGRGCIRDVCRVFDIPLAEVDELAKSVPDTVEGENSLAEEAFAGEIGKKFQEKHPDICKLILKLEGQCRGTGQHASAIIVSNESLLSGTRGNLCIRSDELVSNWDMKDSEYIGLMKLDVLGLNTLSVLNETKRLIEKNKEKLFLYHPESECYFVGTQEDLADGLTYQADFDFNHIPLNDETVYESLHAGKTNGVFQLSARATTDLSKKIKANNILELSDIIALVRPGPADSGMTADYIERKNNGKTWEKKHPLYEKITKHTFGIVIYQEQVMEVIHKVAGLPYSTADKIRKVIGKKRDPKEFKPYEEAFVAGCLKQKTLSKREAEEFWSALQKHANYSFNMSHSVAYAIIGYWTAWCKTYYPVEFICATLTYGSEGKKEELLQEAAELGLNIVPPKVGVSDSRLWVAQDNNLYIPFIEVKGIGEVTAKKLGEAQAKPEAKPINKKFFWPGKTVASEPIQSKANVGKYEKLLMEIEHASKHNPEKLSEYFSFGIPNTVKQTYPILKNLIPQYRGESKWVTLDFNPSEFAEFRLNLIQEKTFSQKNSFSRCKDCDLRTECSGPVPPSSGCYNIAIVGEAPGPSEEEQKMGFVGRSGKMIWDALVMQALFRDQFHVSNVVKCYPQVSKNPKPEQIKTCSEKWLFQKLRDINCRLVLAFGNTGLQAFANQKSGIMHKNGTTEWCEKAGAWICYCLHPSAVLRSNNAETREMFDLGIKNFVEKIRLLVGDF